MSKTVDFKGKPFHFIGIGGIGMSALAYILAKRNLPVSGSDLRSTHITERLQSVGAHIFQGQDARNLEFFQTAKELLRETAYAGVKTGVNGSKEKGERVNRQSPILKSRSPARAQSPQIICSTAIGIENAEYHAAIDRGYPILHRSDLLAALMLEYKSIAVSGTHGKTTTSSAIGYMLFKVGADPTIVVGGEINGMGGNARLGLGEYLVAEADESDGSLIKFAPEIGVVTNIELDHPDHYHSLAEVVRTFKTFTRQCQTTIGCIDCDTVREEIAPQISYSLLPERNADYTVTDIEYRADGTIAKVWEREILLGELQLQLLGEHNLSNILAAVAVGRQVGLEFEAIAKALSSFTGAKRRFEHCGEAKGITFIDDYAHHPSELRATLAAARLRVQSQNGKSPQRLVAIFQPHRFSRTMTFLQEFAESFGDADLVVLTDIYSAGEVDLGQVSGQTLAQSLAKQHPKVFYQPSLAAVGEFLQEILQPGDLALFLGAGNLNQIIPQMLSFYQ
ncbi:MULTISPECIES: UDP-N-acetylmuramate--L-alanine ligase [Spirulina sp. CCY15215]|uniref:UDP-N-acetylmuramate--L-alanine ligase n=1 Tax=Spirulina sp. CCY15215 TaxID=2767591 RepID=UPI00194F5BC4|nr:UDP-N-acetylmuramate--L-alanine ligase [Spirulina major]